MQQLGKVSDHRKKTGSCLSLGGQVQLTEVKPGGMNEADTAEGKRSTRDSTN
jgi:hypothetical protein